MPDKLNKILVQIPKFEAQWKVIHEFKPTGYPQMDPNGHMTLVSLAIKYEQPEENCVATIFTPSQLSLLHPSGFPINYNQLPTVWEWTRIEISHEKEGDEFVLSLVVGGREVGIRGSIAFKALG